MRLDIKIHLKKNNNNKMKIKLLPVSNHKAHKPWRKNTEICWYLRQAATDRRKVHTDKRKVDKQTDVR